MIKTENLVILFTDIAGFTEATSLHSREQNQRILDKHNFILLPIVKRFRGRHIKSIGDALLLVFNSPTDAMRCAMAMQDALHEYNISAPKEEEIHIRIAASLGEVRISKGDIFGEPVNVTSRIEGITPADEVYFSEAVYLAMNKAEVPAIEIGIRDLKGISKPVRIFSIPRYVQNRLVPEPEAQVPADPRLGFPFGGMHLSATAVANQWPPDRKVLGILTRRNIAAASALVVASIGALFLFLGTDQPSSTPPAVAAMIPAVVSPTAATASMEPQGSAVSGQQATAQPTSNPVAVATSAPAVHVGVAPSTHRPSAPARVVEKPKDPGISNIRQAKLAYRGGRITKDRYRQIVSKLEEDLDMAIRRAKADYRDGRISKEVYRTRVQGLKLRYEGE